MNEIIQLGNIFENDKNVKLNKNPQPGRVYSIYGIAPTLSTMQGGHNYEKGIMHEKRCNMRRFTLSEDVCNTITSVEKDNYILVITED